MTLTYHGRPSRRNNIGLSEFLGLPLLDWREPATATPPYPTGLTAGGRIIFQRTKRPVATCNLIATVAGLGQEYDHAR